MYLDLNTFYILLCKDYKSSTCLLYMWTNNPQTELLNIKSHVTYDRAIYLYGRATCISVQ